jgi:hypothetical protein
MKTLENILREMTALMRDVVAASDRRPMPALATLVGYRAADDSIVTMPVDMPENGKPRSELAAMLRSVLAEEGCDRYGWSSVAFVSNDAAHRGSAIDAPDASEVMQIVAASASRVIWRVYALGEPGRPTWTHLRHQDMDTALPGACAGGRWTTLLAPDFCPHGRAIIGDKSAAAKYRDMKRRMMSAAGRA